MQQNVTVDNFPLSDIVATFPEGKRTVKRLIKECEDFLEAAHKEEDEIRGRLSSRVNMFDIDIAVELVMLGRYGNDIERTQVTLSRLKQYWYLYNPPKQSEDGVSEEEKQRAREYPISKLLKVKMHVALCPFHTDRTPSFHVYPDHGYCFSCKKRADAIDIIMVLQNKSFVDAVKYLNAL